MPIIYVQKHLLSLLEFALAEIPSFGVGRVASLFMYPMSFVEFLHADESGMLADYCIKNGIEKPLDTPLHNKLLEIDSSWNKAITGKLRSLRKYNRSANLHGGNVVLNDKNLVWISEDGSFAITWFP